MIELKGLEKVSFTPSIAVKGYLTQEDGTFYWLNDGQGIWLFRKEDVVATSEWDSKDPRFHGRGVILYIKDKAEFFELKPYRTRLEQVPLTAPSATADEISARGGVRGLDALQARQQQFLRGLGVGVDPTTMRNPVSWCPAGGDLWGPDDCGG